jgi:outer membrane protein TolC
MRKPQRAVLLLAAALAAAPASAQALQEREAALSLQACIVAALKNNLGVAVEIITPRLAEMNLNFTREKYIPGLSFGYSSANTSSASFSWIDAAATVTALDNSYFATVSQLVPTGGRVTASLSSYKSDSNRSFQTINPRYGSTLSFSYWQPLLRNFGVALTNRDIVIARNNLDINETQFRSVLQDTIYRVEQAYWTLVYSIENLEVRRQSLGLARDLLVKNKREADVGTIAPIEILNAEAEVATREADILQAETQVISSQDQLLTLMNLQSRDGTPRPGRIVPTDKPDYAQRPQELGACIATALENRTDLQIAKLDLRNKEIGYDYSRNQLLPDLSFSVSYWSPGLSGTQILYQDSNPLTGIIIGTMPGGARDSLLDAFRLKYKNYSFGLSLSVPINNLINREHFAQIRLLYDQARLRIENLEQQVFLEIRNAIRAVELNYKSVQAYRVARELAERKLQGEEKKLKVGLTTNYLVLWQQRDLANARSAELKSLIDYNLALSALERALGTSLKSKNINIAAILDR